jgi:hypothetical protein
VQTTPPRSFREAGCVYGVERAWAGADDTPALFSRGGVCVRGGTGVGGSKRTLRALYERRRVLPGWKGAWARQNLLPTENKHYSPFPHPLPLLRYPFPSRRPFLWPTTCASQSFGRGGGRVSLQFGRAATHNVVTRHIGP